jgi:hypothetical protein
MMSRGTMRFALNDKQWNKITGRIKLPEAARGEIEREIIWYLEICSTWHRPPGEVGKRLNQVSAAASKLAALLKGLETQERLELAEVWPVDVDRLSNFSRVDQAILDAKAISTVCKAAREQISKLNQTTRVDGLIERLDRILLDRANLRVSQAQGTISFLIAVFDIAKIDLSESSIRSYVKRLRGNGISRKKELSKSTSVSRR